MRKGFSLITAIIFLVLIAVLGALALSFSTQSTKQTSDLYLREQAELLLQSGTEYALLAISAHEINLANGCLSAINAKFPNANNALFDVEMRIHYLTSAGSNIATNCSANVFTADITTIDSDPTVIVDTFVKTRNNININPIRLHRRTIQKP